MGNLFEKYIQGYKTASNKIKDLDVKGEDYIQYEEMNISTLEKKLELIGRETRTKSSNSSKQIKLFEEESKSIVEQIAMSTKKIKEYKEKQSEFEKLKTALIAIKDNAKTVKEKKISELEAEKPKIAQKTDIEIIEIRGETEKALKQYDEKLTEIKEREDKYEHAAKDKNYKEYLRSKIEEINRGGEEKIKSCISRRDKRMQEIESDIKQINSDYRDFLINTGKIDRGEEKSETGKPEEGKPKGTTERKTEGKPVEEMDLEGLDERIIDETQRMIDEENSKPKTTKNKPEIVISRKPSINYSKYNIRIGSLRKIMKQKPDQIVTKLQGLLPTKSIQELKKLSENIDPVLLEGIVQLKNKNILTDNEINEALKEFDDKKASKKGTDFNVTYDMKDLSKWAFLPWNRKDRDKIAQLAEDNRDRGIANFKDGQEYEPNPIKRMFKRVTRGKLGEGKAREEEQSEEQLQEGQSEEEQLKKVKSRKNKFYEYVKNTEVSEYFKIINELNKTSDEKDINIIVENAKKALLENKITTDEYHGLLYNVKFKKENADKEKASKPNEKSESGKEGPEDDGEERQ